MSMDEQGMTGSAQVLRGNALALPLADDTVDLVVTSPPYFGLRSYRDGGEHYDGQIGAEATPAEFVDALVAATAEMARVIKPSGSIWVNLGDKYASSSTPGPQSANTTMTGGAHKGVSNVEQRRLGTDGVRQKSLLGIPWRYALACIDDLGLILRAEVIWSKPNGLPESVKDRVRRSHETWFHFVKSPRYFTGIDEIREPAVSAPGREGKGALGGQKTLRPVGPNSGAYSPLGKLPGSVWDIATQPLRVPESLGVDHFAAFPMEWPRRIIRGWSPRGVCVECGAGRRPVVTKTASHREGGYRPDNNPHTRCPDEKRTTIAASTLGMVSAFTITDEACDCPEPTAPTTPGVVLDPFGGTGTTATVAKALGRHGITVDMSADYCRLAEWRTNDHKELDKARYGVGRHKEDRTKETAI